MHVRGRIGMMCYEHTSSVAVANGTLIIPGMLYVSAVPAAGTAID